MGIFAINANAMPMNTGLSTEKKSSDRIGNIRYVFKDFVNQHRNERHYKRHTGAAPDALFLPLFLRFLFLLHTLPLRLSFSLFGRFLRGVLRALVQRAVRTGFVWFIAVQWFPPPLLSRSPRAQTFQPKALPKHMR